MKIYGDPVLRIKIDFDGEPTGFDCENGKVLMIPFKGRVEGDIFNGTVVPGGVDTQVVNAAGVRHMSARYILKGTDRDGRECHIYVENNGWFSGDDVTMPFYTVPTFMTDSRCLAPYLHRNRFVGEGRNEADGLWIYFYETGARRI